MPITFGPYSNNLGAVITSGNYLYSVYRVITNNRNVILRIDLTNPSDVNYLWSNTISNNGIASDDTYIYTVGGEFIERIPISDPNLRDPTWRTYAGANARGLVVYDGYLYIASVDSSTIGKVSLTDPSDNNANWATSAAPEFVTVSGSYVYAARAGGYIQRVSLTDPSGDNIIAWANSSPEGRPSGNAFCIASYDDYLYVCNQPADLSTFYDLTVVQKIQISNPSNVVAFANTTSIYNVYFGVCIYNNSVCIANTWVFPQVFFMDPPPTYLFFFDPFACLLEGTKILTNNGYKDISDLRRGDLIKTLLQGYKSVDCIGLRQIFHTPSNINNRVKDQLYVCSQANYADVFEDLVLTGCHSILVDDFVSREEKEKTVETNGDTYVTEKKYRLPACVDSRACIFQKEGHYNIYHIVLENEDVCKNYGIFANGLLVESCSKEFMEKFSNMRIL